MSNRSDCITKVTWRAGSPLSLDLGVFEGFRFAPSVGSQEVLRHDVVIVGELFLLRQVSQLGSLSVVKVLQ